MIQEILNELKQNKRKYIIIALAALAIRFVIFAPLGFLWEGWLVSITAVSSVLVEKYLRRVL